MHCGPWRQTTTKVQTYTTSFKSYSAKKGLVPRRGPLRGDELEFEYLGEFEARFEIIFDMNQEAWCVLFIKMASSPGSN
jgi:hypothetical protein